MDLSLHIAVKFIMKTIKSLFNLYLKNLMWNLQVILAVIICKRENVPNPVIFGSVQIIKSFCCQDGLSI